MKKTFTLFVCLLALLTAPREAFALKLYWKGGSGLFADQNKWWVGSYNSGVTAYQQPISTDTVYFTAAAFAASGGVISVDRHVSCGAMIWDATLPNVVQFTSTSVNWYLDIYGEVRLAQAPNLDFYFTGIMRLVSTQAGVVPITSNGQRLRLNRLEIGATGSVATRFELQDALYVDDPAQVNHAGAATGYINLINGQFVTNGHPLRFDYFQSRDNNLTTRGIDISGSYVTIEGSHPYAQHWGINFNATLATPNFNLFNTAGSTIHIKTYNGLAWYKQVYLGIGLVYGDMISDAPLRIYGENTNPLTAPNRFGFIDFKQSAYFSHTTYISADDIYFAGGALYQSYHRTNVVEAERFHNNSGCGAFITFEALLGSAVDSRGIIRQRAAGSTFTMSNMILIDFECDVAAGRTYNAVNSIRRGYAPLSAVPFNWNLTAATGQDYYFVGRNMRTVGGNSYPNWSDPANWDVWNGTAWVPNGSSCIPSPADNVFVGANSFPSYTAGVTTPAATANKGLLAIDTTAYCNRMTWLDDLPNQSSMIFVNTGNIIQSELNIFGSAYFEKKMRNVNAGFFNFYGAQPDSIWGDSTYMWTYSYMKRYSDYHIIGDNNVNSLDWRTRGISSESNSTLRTNFVQFGISEFRPLNRYMDSTQVYFIASGGTFNDNGGTAVYTGNTTWHLYGAWTNPNPAGTVSIGAGRLPNVIGYCNMSVGSTYYQTYWGGSSVADLNDRKCEVQGDLRLLQNGYFYNNIDPTHFCRLEVTGSMAEYNGDVYLSAGKTYEFSPHPTAKFEIKNGSLFSVGDCQNMVKIKTVSGQPITFNVAQTATSNVQYTYIEGLNNTGAPLNVYNSIDGGSNTNINFLASGAGVTYYWRRHKTNSKFTGNWLDPAHWTTNPAQTHGDSLCIPTILDSVIVDAMSSNGGAGLDSIIINDIAFCGTIWFKADKRTTSLSTGAGRLYIGQSMILFNNMGFHNFSGAIYFVGSGDIRTNGTPLKNANIFFNKEGGVWNIRDYFTATNTINSSYGNVYLYAGRINTNNNTLDITGTFGTGSSTQLREVYAGSSTFQMRSTANAYAWSVAYTNTFRFYGDSSVINMYYSPALRYYTMGAGNATDSVVNYNIVNFYGAQGQLNGRSNFRFARFAGDMLVVYNNSYDSIYFEGGYFYRFYQNTTQTLNAPHGKIIANGSPTAFVNIETAQPGLPLASRSRFYKAYGSGFCLDFVKVKENRAEKNTLATTPAAWQPLYSLLKFETGVNSDNINGTATGIWDFSLPIPYDPVVTGGTNFNLCAAGDAQTVPIQIKGNGPYIVSATWTNNLGASGTIQDTVPDDDANANTPFTYNLLVSQMSTSTSYTLDLSTLRCGEATPSNIVTVNVSMPDPDILVQVERFDTCFLTNKPTWQTFFDDIDGRPMLSIQDQVSPADLDSLKQVNSSVHFNPAVQRLPLTSACLPDAPYLERWWRIEPQNNTPARVRLYFTAQELLNLTNNTWLLGSGRSLYPDSEIMVLKYSSGTVGVGPCQIVPHTVVSWNASTSAPFTSTTNVIGVEFQVNSFSAFVIVPVQAIVLANGLLDFQAQKIDQQAQLSWTMENGQELSHFIVQRASQDMHFAPIAEVPAQSVAAAVDYQAIDRTPLQGTNYYRLQLVSRTGSVDYSATRALDFERSNSFNIYPNPATDQIQIVGQSRGGAAQIQVLDALGRVLISQPATLPAGDFQQNLNLHDLAPALYILRIQHADGSTQTARFHIH